MQAGTLRKRKRRNITKVGGLTTIPYDENADNFDGFSLFTDHRSDDEGSHLFATRSKVDTKLHMNSGVFRSSRMGSGISSFSRPTRNPAFHYPPDILSSKNDGEGSGDRPYSAWSRGGTTFNSDFVVKEERSRFIDKASINRLRILIFLGQISLTLPWKWNEKEWRIEKWSPTLEHIQKLLHSFSLIQAVGITCFQINCASHLISTGNHESYRETFMLSMAVCWCIYCLLFNLTLILYKEEFREYINTMLRFNRDYVEKYLVHLDDFKDGGRIIINVGIPTNCFQVICASVFFLVMPYQPWYMFSYIYPKPWYWLVPGVIQEIVTVGQTLTCYLFVGWIMVAHCNTVQFWLAEAHNHNGSDYTSNELRLPRFAMETYKSLQILCNLLNDCMSPLAIPLMKFTIFTALIPCGYVLIRSMNHLFIDEFPGILTYPLSVIDCATVGFGMLTMAAEMHDMASSFLDSWSRTKSNNFRRLLMSLPSLKVKVGRFYFITISTTITFFQFVFDFITDTIITFP